MIELEAAAHGLVGLKPIRPFRAKELFLIQEEFEETKRIYEGAVARYERAENSVRSVLLQIEALEEQAWGSEEVDETEEDQAITACADNVDSDLLPPGTPGVKKGKPPWYDAGGYYFDGDYYELNPRPLSVLALLVESHPTRLSYNSIQDKLETVVSDDTVRDWARDIRESLRIAIEKSGIECDDPIPSKRGTRSYRLAVEKKHFSREPQKS